MRQRSQGCIGGLGKIVSGQVAQDRLGAVSRDRSRQLQSRTGPGELEKAHWLTMQADEYPLLADRRSRYVGQWELDLHRDELHGRSGLEDARCIRHGGRRVVEDHLAAFAGCCQCCGLSRSATCIPPRSKSGADYACKNAKCSIIHMLSSIRLWWNAMGMPPT